MNNKWDTYRVTEAETAGAVQSLNPALGVTDIK